MPWFNRITRKDGDAEIPGTYVHAFIHNGDDFLSEIKIYADGKVDCWGLVDLETFKQKVRSGWIVTQLPEHAHLSVSELASFVASEVRNYVEPEEFIKEVVEEIEELNRRPTAADRCRTAYQAFQTEQTEAARERLKQTYEAIPAHLRRYVLRDMDAKDLPIRMIIYGDDEIEKWSHRIAARKMGLRPLPTIRVPGVSQWLTEFDAESVESRIQAADAVQRMGSATVPWLVSRLRQHDSRLKLKLIDLCNRQSLFKPRFVPATKWQYRAIVACDALGPTAQDALPALEELLHHRCAPVAAYVMARIGPAAVPALEKASTNETKAIRLAARVSLDLQRTRSDILVPPSGASLVDSEFKRRICRFNLKMLQAAYTDYMGQHPERMLPRQRETRPNDSRSQDTNPTQKSPRTGAMARQ